MLPFHSLRFAEWKNVEGLFGNDYSTNHIAKILGPPLKL